MYGELFSITNPAKNDYRTDNWLISSWLSLTFQLFYPLHLHRISPEILPKNEQKSIIAILFDFSMEKLIKAKFKKCGLPPPSICQIANQKYRFKVKYILYQRKNPNKKKFNIFKYPEKNPLRKIKCFKQPNSYQTVFYFFNSSKFYFFFIPNKKKKKLF